MTESLNQQRASAAQRQEDASKTMEISLAVLKKEVEQLTVTVNEIKEIVTKRTPWPTLVLVGLAVLAPAGALWKSTTDADSALSAKIDAAERDHDAEIVALKLTDRDSMNERREMRETVRTLVDRNSRRDQAKNQ